VTEEDETAAFVAREKALFEDHLEHVFGERRKEFSEDLVALLHTLWRRGRDAPRGAKFDALTYKPRKRPTKAPKAMACPDCTGVGWRGRDAAKCLRCNGAGTVTVR
jgi:DnaJ-class molecular chaperone